MSLSSDAAKAHIEKLLNDAYPEKQAGIGIDGKPMLHQFCWKAEYRFAEPRRWAFDYAVPALKVAIEIDGGTFQSQRTGHSSGVGLRAWREKNNAAMSLDWSVWHYAPEEIIKAGRISQKASGSNTRLYTGCVTLPDKPILLKLPWM